MSFQIKNVQIKLDLSKFKNLKSVIKLELIIESGYKKEEIPSSVTDVDRHNYKYHTEKYSVDLDELQEDGDNYRMLSIHCESDSIFKEVTMIAYYKGLFSGERKSIYRISKDKFCKLLVRQHSDNSFSLTNYTHNGRVKKLNHFGFDKVNMEVYYDMIIKGITNDTSLFIVKYNWMAKGAHVTNKYLIHVCEEFERFSEENKDINRYVRRVVIEDYDNISIYLGKNKLKPTIGMGLGSYGAENRLICLSTIESHGYFINNNTYVIRRGSSSNDNFLTGVAIGSLL